MSKKSRELVQGTLEMLILKTLALEPLHGYAIAMRIEQISEGVFRVGPGSLFLPSAGWKAPGTSAQNGTRQRTIAAPSTTD